MANHKVLLQHTSSNTDGNRNGIYQNMIRNHQNDLCKKNETATMNFRRPPFYMTYGKNE